MTKDQADTAYEDSPITYLFGLGDGSIVIDGHCMAMFINHSCDANCETSEEDGRVWITAIRNIAAGDEITYDYCLYDGGDDEALCNCGAKTCRGTMYSREEIRRRKAEAKTARKKALKKRGAGPNSMATERPRGTERSEGRARDSAPDRSAVGSAYAICGP